ncbi:Hypothetical predicted protein [Mytilus galloprovincialis]|uniref:Uncharacterized protein n=1 Tax=Mytilus galloprovincialis TaxID=29158 RepID=A0A8B6D4I3_MYTGA|nr:Hypothetical predicted protein [Mytilus galloprovincialis]
MFCLGCQKGFWGRSCEEMCSKSCIERHCYPGNGTCVWGCYTENCLNNSCSILTGDCTDGCKLRRTGEYCNEYNLASDGLVVQYPSGNEPARFANDGSKKSCSKTKGPNVTFQVDLKKESIVTGVYITFGKDTTNDGKHIYYASNTSDFLTNGTILYEGQIENTNINFSAVLRYLTYVPPVHDNFSELEICEIGIIGCSPIYYGSLCDKSCPRNCRGPCDLQTGKCIFGCLNGLIGDKCELACLDGTYGKNCLETCSATCVRTYCDKVTGECTEGCDDGWQGFDCTQKCLSGQFGKNCSEFCDGCISQMCDHVTGVCDNSTACKPGYVYDKYCNTACNQGFYGSNCLRICSSFCLHLPCDPGTGTCIGGCVQGFQGLNCSQVSQQTKESEEVPTRIGIFSGGFLLGILITTVVCCLIVKTRQLRKKQIKDNTAMKTQRHDVQQYDDVGMENVSTYQDLRKDGANDYDQINIAYANH